MTDENENSLIEIYLSEGYWIDANKYGSWVHKWLLSMTWYFNDLIWLLFKQKKEFHSDAEYNTNYSIEVKVILRYIYSIDSMQIWSHACFISNIYWSSYYYI